MIDADNQVAAQNAEAANANPTEAPADTAITSGVAGGQISTGGVEGNASNPTSAAVDVPSSAAAGAASTDESKMIIGSGVNMVEVQKAQVISTLAATPATQTEDDQHLKDVLEMYLKAAESRFKHLLTGMENSTAAMLKALGDGLVHLSDHIEQQNAIATKEETNV